MTRRNRHGAEEAEVENHERWLLTYADMITLLLALFIVLFAASSINAKKFLALAIGFQQTFNPDPGVLPSSNGVLQNASLVPTAGSVAGLSQGATTTTTTVPSSPTTTVTSDAPSTIPTAAAPSANGQQSLATIESQVNQALAAKGLNATATTSVSSQGLVIQILSDHVFYATDVASLNPVGNEVVDTVAGVLSTDSNNLEVEGFTDDAPIVGGPYTSNMQLSAERAVNVAVRLYSVDGIAQSRLAVVGNGPNDPVEPNTSAANMAKNRRVDIVILSPGQSQP